jgi:hypothetical protein
MAKHILVLMEDEYEGSQLIRALEAAEFYAKSTYDDCPDLLVLDSTYRGSAVLRTLQELDRKFHVTRLPVVLLGPSPSSDIGKMIKRFGSSKAVPKLSEPKVVIEAMNVLFQRLGIGEE